MARRGWGGSIATAVGVAAGAGAAQLGFGYGLGIIDWAPPEGTADVASWVAGLIWATWIAATSTVAGAVCARWLRDRATDPDASDTPSDTLGSLALAVAAVLGASITVLLVAVPARVAVAPETSSPRTVAATYATVGLLLGVLTALWALRSRAAATNVLATVGWLWALAVVAVLDGVLAGRGLTTAQLGIWQLSANDPAYWIRDWFYWPGAVLSLGSALLIGALAARRAARHADRRIGAAASGAAGPLLVATAYLVAVPGLTTIDPQQLSAHLIAPYAVIVGIGGSVLVAALAQRASRRAAARAAVPTQRTGEPSTAGETRGDDARTPDDGRTDPTGADTGPDGSTPVTDTRPGTASPASGTSTVEVTPIVMEPPTASPVGRTRTEPTPTEPAPTATIPAQRTGAEPATGDGSDTTPEAAPPTRRPRAPRRPR
ncbi:hypothetical protein [Micromonospora sp. NPDC049497]|uniref:hypothetical protein n=1 Tax=Micromonospora sp. NPDC049497 TaxID=3364273 RepID=UPI0037B5CD7F